MTPDSLQTELSCCCHVQIGHLKFEVKWHNSEASKQDDRGGVAVTGADDTPPQCGACSMHHREARHDIAVAPGPVVVRYCQRHCHVSAVMGKDEERNATTCTHTAGWNAQGWMGCVLGVA